MWLRVAVIGLVVAVIFQNYLVVGRNRELRTRIETLTREEVRVGDEVPGVVGIGLDGQRIAFWTTKQAKPTVMFSMSGGCYGCVESLPAWQRLGLLANSRGLATVCVSKDSVPTMLEKLPPKANLPCVMIADPNHGTFLELRMNVVPRTVVVGPDGKVRRVWTGALLKQTEDEISTYVSQLAASTQ